MPKGNTSPKMPKAKKSNTAKTKTSSTGSKSKAKTSSTMAKAPTSTKKTTAKKKLSMEHVEEPFQIKESVDIVNLGKSKPTRGMSPGTALGEPSTTGKRRKGKRSNSDPAWPVRNPPSKKQKRLQTPYSSDTDSDSVFTMLKSLKSPNSACSDSYSDSRIFFWLKYHGCY